MNAKDRQKIKNHFYHRCFVCGYPHFLDIHHISHKKDGGDDTLDNSVVLCPNHHKEWHYIENTYFRKCKKAEAQRLVSGRDHKAFDMCIEAVRSVFEKGTVPCNDVMNKEYWGK